ncbi:MAG: hypothetical protein M1383_02920 [Patescibacteria group bacterium]|nr:hypothetical protein [Patescibacteria group bacterium]
MPEYPKNPERKEPFFCENMKEGFNKLFEIANQKRTELKRRINIVLDGLPNSGKSYLGKIFSDNHFDQKSGIEKSVHLVGMQKYVWPTFQERLKHADFITIEEIGPRDGIDYQLKRITGNDSDIFVYLYNPRRKKGIDGTYMKDADIVIQNVEANLKVK